jgi:hypothetical protein
LSNAPGAPRLVGGDGGELQSAAAAAEVPSVTTTGGAPAST